MALSAMLNKLGGSTRDALSSLVALMAFARSEYGEPAAEQVPGNGGPVQRAAQAGTIISVVVIAVIALVGILILARINDALPAISNNDLANSSDAVLSGFSGAMDLVPVVLLVLVASLVIGVVQRLRTTN